VRELTTNQKGAIAEAAITKAAIEPGIEVYRPAIEGGRHDMIFALSDGRLIRVQCNQQRFINWAKDYEFGARLPALLGPIAQLGERLAGSQKVAGSSPAGSIA
jgi:hypothetical protein